MRIFIGMDLDTYFSLMKNRLKNAFDFQSAPGSLGLPIEVWAVHNRKSEKYFLSKKVSLYSFKNDEYVGLVRCSEGLSMPFLEKAVDEFKKLINSLPVDEEHMSSIFTLAFVCPGSIGTEQIAYLSKIKYHKDYMFTFRGWSDLAVIAVDLQDNCVYSNGFGKKLEKNFKISDTEK